MTERGLSALIRNDPAQAIPFCTFKGKRVSETPRASRHLPDYRTIIDISEFNTEAIVVS